MCIFGFLDSWSQAQPNFFALRTGVRKKYSYNVLQWNGPNGSLRTVLRTGVAKKFEWARVCIHEFRCSNIVIKFGLYTICVWCLLKIYFWKNIHTANLTKQGSPTISGWAQNCSLRKKLSILMFCSVFYRCSNRLFCPSVTWRVLRLCINGTLPYGYIGKSLFLFLVFSVCADFYISLNNL